MEGQERSLPLLSTSRDQLDFVEGVRRKAATYTYMRVDVHLNISIANRSGEMPLSLPEEASIHIAMFTAHSSTT